MRTYDFTLPFRLLTFNKLMRMHFRTRKKHLSNVAWHVIALAGPPPPQPLTRARIVIERESTQEPDPDGLPATAKALLDVLQPCSRRHPLGLGYILNDSSKCIDLEVRHITGKGDRTRVVICEIP